MFPPRLTELAAVVLNEAKSKGFRIATAESCTGGLIAGLLTEIPGSSDVVERGFVTYSNEAKADLLGIPMALIQENGAVSEPVARAMAEGAVQHSLAQLAVSVTGIAGPGGGSADKPVGLVHMAVAQEGGPTLHEEHRFGDAGRGIVRLKTVEAALRLLLKLL
jgi:nicotinamide-nucleotide amidase